MGENAGRLMLLDTAALYFRAFFGVPDRFRAPDGTSVNAARGLLDMIARLTEAYEPDRIIACWDDDWRPAWRVDLIPTYKEHRVVEEVAGAPDVEEAPDALRAQVPVIREYLGLLGIPVVGAAEHEADDVIGTLATRHEHVDVVTGDRDLFQLIDDPADVRIIYTARGMSNLEVVTGDVVEAKYGITAGQYADFATMRGDASDGLPGVKGVGDKTAAALLQQHGDLGAIRQAAAAEAGMTPAVAKKIVAAADYLDAAPRVVAVARDLDLAEPVPGVPDRTAAEEFAERWGIESSMRRALDALAQGALNDAEGRSAPPPATR
ncbi:5'-3' exonuclease [Microbacterium sp. JB110]|uniref:5'-3' exonuclease n=1 Tax=unclassified Microbacterium TaxID=2609290 RepID=UPI00097E9369|nr:5'-3' exonuclease [Microbacterium sp. JB110]SJM53608.1 DNA polymerase I [Frigoribacterium sp. JB110]